jgi:anti-anti-sigma factor
MTDVLIDRCHGIVHLAGDLHPSDVQELRDTFAAMRDEELLVDLSEVRYLSTAALGVFVEEAERRSVRLRNASALHCQVLAATGTEWLVDGVRR